MLALVLIERVLVIIVVQRRRRNEFELLLVGGLRVRLLTAQNRLDVYIFNLWYPSICDLRMCLRLCPRLILNLKRLSIFRRWRLLLEFLHVYGAHGLDWLVGVHRVTHELRVRRHIRLLMITEMRLL